MAGLRHINDVLDVNWNKFNRDYPGLFYMNEAGHKSMPLIVPASVLRNDHAPIYLRRLVDQDPTSYYMLIAADPTKGAVDRETAVDFFEHLFYVLLGMPSSYDKKSGMRPTPENPDFGTMERRDACSKEVLPAADDAAFRRHYDEVVNGYHEPTPEEKEAERLARIERLGFDPDDGNTIDITLDDDPTAAAPTVNPGPTRTTIGDDFSMTVGGHEYSVSFLNKICYAVDFHMTVGMEIGYDGGRHNVGGRRTQRLREALDTVDFSKKICAALDKAAEGKSPDDVEISDIKTFVTKDSESPAAITGFELKDKIAIIKSSLDTTSLEKCCSFADFWEAIDLSAKIDGFAIQTPKETFEYDNVDSITYDDMEEGIVFNFKGDGKGKKVDEGLLDDIWNGKTGRDSAAELEVPVDVDDEDAEYDDKLKTGKLSKDDIILHRRKAGNPTIDLNESEGSLTTAEIAEQIKQLVRSNPWKAKSKDEIFIGASEDDARSGHCHTINKIEFNHGRLEFIHSYQSDPCMTFADLCYCLEDNNIKLSDLPSIRFVNARSNVGTETVISVTDMTMAERTSSVSDNSYGSMFMGDEPTSEKTEKNYLVFIVGRSDPLAKLNSTSTVMGNIDEGEPLAKDIDRYFEAEADQPLNESFSRSQISYWNSLIND